MGRRPEENDPVVFRKDDGSSSSKADVTVTAARDIRLSEVKARLKKAGSR